MLENINGVCYFCQANERRRILCVCLSASFENKKPWSLRKLVPQVLDFDIVSNFILSLSKGNQEGVERTVFRIGEFSTIAQVSGRQLRHYDQLGLLKPIYIDPETGYRYYSASQLPRLNRILALKELGLTLDQIGQFLEENVSADELRKMLHRKQEEIEQAMRESQMHLNYIETRIKISEC